MMWRDPKKKCICKRCEDCQLYQDWTYTNNKTEQKELQKHCIFEVVKIEMPLIKGRLIGCEAASNEARNRADEVKSIHAEFMRTINETLQALPAIFIQTLMEQVKSARSGLSDTTDRRSQQRLADQPDTPE